MFIKIRRRTNRPVSNLLFVGKLVERRIRLNQHMSRGATRNFLCRGGFTKLGHN